MFKGIYNERIYFMISVSEVQWKYYRKLHFQKKNSTTICIIPNLYD